AAPPESSEPPEESSGRPKMPPNPCPKLTLVPYLRAMPDSFAFKLVKFYRTASSRTGGVICFTCWRSQYFQRCVQCIDTVNRHRFWYIRNFFTVQFRSQEYGGTFARCSNHLLLHPTNGPHSTVRVNRARTCN